MAATNEFPDLPEDEMTEILARLPVKSLLRFKCVRKSWYDLIKNPSFILKHVNYASSNNDDHAPGIALKQCSESPIGKYEVSFLSNKGVEISDARITLKHCSGSSMKVYGHCNGIIIAVQLLHSNKSPSGDPISLWNPATREIKRLPVPLYPDKYFLTIGFGFDIRSNDYKVIRISDLTERLTRRRIFDPLVEVYNSSTDSWRELEAELPKTIGFCATSSSSLNGFCYWLAYLTEDASRIKKKKWMKENGLLIKKKNWLADGAYKYGRFVLCFDLANEKFEKIPLPGMDSNRVPKLLKFEETIALIEYKGFFDGNAVWVLNMNGDGEKKTWTKLYNIPSNENCVLGFLKNGEALTIDGSLFWDYKFTLYDPSTQQKKILREFYDSFYKCDYQMVDYVESLVSFKGN